MDRWNAPLRSPEVGELQFRLSFEAIALGGDSGGRVFY